VGFRDRVEGSESRVRQGWRGRGVTFFFFITLKPRVE